jgi:hypothetical protein
MSHEQLEQSGADVARSQVAMHRPCVVALRARETAHTTMGNSPCPSLLQDRPSPVAEPRILLCPSVFACCVSSLLFPSLCSALLCSALLCSPATGTTARRPQSTRSLCCQPHSCLGCAAVVFRSPACGACASAQGAVCSPLAPPLLPQLAAVRRFLVTTGPPRGARKQPASHGWWVGSAALCLLSLASGPVLLLRSGVPIRPLRPRRWALGHSAGGASSN